MSNTQSGSAQRQHIMDVALKLMAQHGVDGTSMRDLAAAADLNVASLYHYFPSKADLLVAVLEEQGFLVPDNVWDSETPSENGGPPLASMVNEVLQSMLQVDDFIRLMLGEVMRGDETALTVGRDLLADTQTLLESWLAEHPDDVRPGTSPAGFAHLLRATVVGLFYEHIAGVFESSPSGLRERADEIAALLSGPTP